MQILEAAGSDFSLYDRYASLPASKQAGRLFYSHKHKKERSNGRKSTLFKRKAGISPAALHGSACYAVHADQFSLQYRGQHLGSQTRYGCHYRSLSCISLTEHHHGPGSGTGRRRQFPDLHEPGSRKAGTRRPSGLSGPFAGADPLPCIHSSRYFHHAPVSPDVYK